jgi:hypothetical protein
LLGPSATLSQLLWSCASFKCLVGTLNFRTNLQGVVTDRLAIAGRSKGCIQWGLERALYFCLP